jgi:hypothetical protein
MGAMRILSLLLSLTWLLSACVAQPSQAPTLAQSVASSPSALLPPTITQSRSTPKSLSTSSNGGEPRTTGYWLLWNACADGNQAETAKANGGKQAGWIIMDDLLAEAGVLVGTLQIETCKQGVSLLQGRNLQGAEMKNDAAYTLAAQLLAAQLNLATGSEYCPASDQAVSQAQLLLLGLNFDGMGGYLGPPLAGSNIDKAKMLTEQLADYNSGVLCR